MENVISLSKVNTADDMVIMDVRADAEHKDRLQSIGFVPGTVVSFVTKMAFGGPMAFQVRGSKIVIRKNDADCVLVKPFEPSYA